MGLGTVFLSHYRRHPGQLLGLLLILVCAAMLWSGVRSLTGSAESAVARSRAALEPLQSVSRADGRPLEVADFARLRQAGLCASPRLDVRFVRDGAPDVIGLDPFTSSCLRQYRMPDGPGEDEGSYAAMTAKLIASLNRPLLLGRAEDFARWQQLALPGTADIQFEQLDGLPFGQLFTDISVAADLASHGRSTLAILLPALEKEKLSLPDGYRVQVENYGVAPGPLVDAFLLSLNALGALTLLVAALLVRSVYRFALEQRRRSLEILVRFGVQPGKLRIALLTEVLLIALIGGSLGLWLGGHLASVMAEGFQGTLSGLFNVDTLAQRAPSMETWLGMVLILALLVGWAGMDLLFLRHGSDRTANFRQSAGRAAIPGWRIVAALVLVAVSLFALLGGTALWLLFSATMGCLIGVGMLLPELLNSLLAHVERHRRQPLLEWSCSEMRALCRLLGLPLTALAFAIATAIGVQAMVTGFESTFARWLDQRLQGDLYLDPGHVVSTREWRDRLQQLPGVSAVLPMVRGRALLEMSRGNSARFELPVDVFAIDPASALLQDWPFLSAIKNHWAELTARGVLINEQLARRESLSLGDRIQFRLGDESLSREVIGIYADYGRPEGELMLPLSLVPPALPSRYSTFALGVDDVRRIHWQDWPQQYPWMAGSRLRDQAGLKQAANAAFARTFQMTRMLNGLTLSLAGTALALMGLVIFRLRQGSYTLLHVYGVPRKRLRHRLIVHSVLVTGLLALLAIPLGIFLGWVLVARVNPAAFGWALPMHFYPGFWLQVWLVCLLIGAVVGVLAGNPVRLEALKSE